MPRFAALLATVLASLVLAPALAADNALSQQANTAFLSANAKKAGVIIRPSGLQYRIIRNGFGKRPGALDSVDVYYKGSLINGTVFDQTEPGLPANFVVNKLIPGWTEALEIMKEGDHWELVIPAGLAYGSRGAGGVIPPDQTLVFDLELVKVAPAPKDQGQDQNPQ
ncbi:MAG TPA: FKBP-type peptidyl-prolyl cis-trans isomerase [Beijerinckiaceae bacterium]|jgi:FKBP-type peptidyl-prolyl cis-trans isomerase|nr:FKBP-type peptidyl-prolyl cis-trans isomerase [Beijerinckiaceae bacterium]